MSMTQTSSESPTSAQPDTSDTKRRRDGAGADGSPNKVRAWIGGDGEGHQHVVWCDERNKARQQLANELGLQYMEVQEFGRYPQLDGFKGNLREWQLANGWHFECQQCYRYAYGREEGDDSDGEFAILDKDDHVFCSKKCQDKHRAYWAMHHAIDDAVAGDFLRRFSWLCLRSVYHNEFGGFAIDSDGKTHQVFEFFGPREDYYHRRRILLELQEAERVEETSNIE